MVITRKDLKPVKPVELTEEEKEANRLLGKEIKPLLEETFEVKDGSAQKEGR